MDIRHSKEQLSEKGGFARASAARDLNAILSGKRTTDWAAAKSNRSSLSLELIYGCLRHYFSLSAQVDALLAKPLRAKDSDIQALLLVGAYQLQHTRIPPHAALFETVASAKLLGKPWAKGLVNGVLRKISHSPPQATEHPPWLEKKLTAQYGADAASLMRANNNRAPLCLRINRRKLHPTEYRKHLDAADIAYADTWLTQALVLRSPQPATTLPGFDAGWVAVQDLASQLAVLPLLRRVAAGERLLDACSAPGGKLFRLMETAPSLPATAIDISPRRIATMQNIAKRLGHRQFNSLQADATALDWWDGRPFDHVLLDAPCSGTGTLRRHPEIKVLRKPTDLRRNTKLQAELLANLWRTVRRGGTLLYCTCSILAEENENVVSAFLGSHRDARACGFSLPSGRATDCGWQLLPLEPTTDGAYVALLEKRT